jgi:hypothetical protein
LVNNRGLVLMNVNRLDLRQVFVELRVVSSPVSDRASLTAGFYP